MAHMSRREQMVLHQKKLNKLKKQGKKKIFMAEDRVEVLLWDYNAGQLNKGKIPVLLELLKEAKDTKNFKRIKNEQNI